MFSANSQIDEYQGKSNTTEQGGNKNSRGHYLRMGIVINGVEQRNDGRRSTGLENQNIARQTLNTQQGTQRNGNQRREN